MTLTRQGAPSSSSAPTRQDARDRAVVVTAIGIAVESFATGTHHLYGAIKDGDMFRASVVGVLVVAGLASALMLRAYRRQPRRGLLSGFVAFASLIYVGWFGLIEGGYNHVARPLSYLAGASEEVMRSVFVIRYKVPRDVFFEITGALTFAAALAVVWGLWALVRSSGATVRDQSAAD